MENTNKCIVCNKALRAIHSARKNGCNYMHDWSNRKTHKKCYEIHMAERVNKDLERLALKFYTNQCVEVDFLDDVGIEG